MNDVFAAPSLEEAALAPPELRSQAGEVATGIGYYVYGVLRAVEPGDARLYTWEQPQDQAVELVTAGGLAAVVSQVSLAEFGDGVLAGNLRDLDWVEGRVRGHHRVLIALLAGDLTPVPMRFCTLFQSEDRVRQMLVDHNSLLCSALERLEGRAEWGVKMFCDSTAVRRRVEQRAEGTRTFDGTTGAGGPGTAYFLRKKLEKMLDAEVERVTDEAAQASHEALARLAADAVVLALQDQEVTRRAERMLLNGAYLLDRHRLLEFERELDRLTLDYGPLGCSFELTGPWPAYNFVKAVAAEASGG
ncbi:MAG: GvpL/GvpF family gas vesicle protein [Thermoleophilia bacterium]|nr:GvpL/GvpF family gas vesicle protein [Thermoleophilia bacterium]